MCHSATVTFSRAAHQMNIWCWRCLEFVSSWNASFVMIGHDHKKEKSNMDAALSDAALSQLAATSKFWGPFFIDVTWNLLEMPRWWTWKKDSSLMSSCFFILLSSFETKHERAAKLNQKTCHLQFCTSNDQLIGHCSQVFAQGVTLVQHWLHIWRGNFTWIVVPSSAINLCEKSKEKRLMIQEKNMCNQHCFVCFQHETNTKDKWNG